MLLCYKEAEQRPEGWRGKEYEVMMHRESTERENKEVSLFPRPLRVHWCLIFIFLSNAPRWPLPSHWFYKKFSFTASKYLSPTQWVKTSCPSSLMSSPACQASPLRTPYPLTLGPWATFPQPHAGMESVNGWWESEKNLTIIWFYFINIQNINR